MCFWQVHSAVGESSCSPCRGQQVGGTEAAVLGHDVICQERGQTHVLLQGDSAEMLPRSASYVRAREMNVPTERFQHIEFDLMFIDGNHAYEVYPSDDKGFQ